MGISLMFFRSFPSFNYLPGTAYTRVTQRKQTIAGNNYMSTLTSL